MNQERNIKAYKDYFLKFIKTLRPEEARKIFYVLDMLKTNDRVSAKFVKHLKEGLYELRAECNGNIFRVFFIFDADNIVVLFHGFQKKTQKTPTKEINQALKLKKEYEESRLSTDGH